MKEFLEAGRLFFQLATLGKQAENLPIVGGGVLFGETHVGHVFLSADRIGKAGQRDGAVARGEGAPEAVVEPGIIQGVAHGGIDGAALAPEGFARIGEGIAVDELLGVIPVGGSAGDG